MIFLQKYYIQKNRVILKIKKNKKNGGKKAGGAGKKQKISTIVVCRRTLEKNKITKYNNLIKIS